MRKMLRIIGIGLLIVFIGIQLIRPNQTNPPVDPKTDFLTLTQPPTEIATMIRNTCYDCHSHETKYPWYANIAPVSWILQDHIMEGRESLNFSKWGTPEAFGEGEEGEGSGEALEEIVEVIQEGEMPLWDYKLMHPEARLNESQKTQLIAWFQNVPGGNAARSTGGREESEVDED
jgi:hypothetical protein